MNAVRFVSRRIKNVVVIVINDKKVLRSDRRLRSWEIKVRMVAFPLNQ